MLQNGNTWLARQNRSLSNRTVLRAAAAAVLVLSPVIAAAQTGPETEEPSVPGWVFTPSIGVGVSRDTNVLLLTVPDNPPRDYGLPLTPSARLDYRGKYTTVSGEYDGSFLFYRNLDELNSADHQVNAQFRHRASRRTTIFGQENLTSSSTTSTLLIAGVPFYRLGSRANALGGGVDVLLSSRTTLHTDYTHQLVTFDRSAGIPASLAGGYAHQVTTSLAQAVSSTLTIGGRYDLTRAVLAEGEDRFNIHTGTMIVELRVSPHVVLSGFAGVSRTTATATHDARTGPAVRAAITRRDRRSVFIASYERTFVPSFGFGGTFPNQEWHVALRVPFSRTRAYVEGGLTRFDNEPIALTQEKLRSLFVSGIVGYRATRWVNLEGFYRRSQQNLRGELRRDEVGARIVASKPTRFR